MMSCDVMMIMHASASCDMHVTHMCNIVRTSLGKDGTTHGCMVDSESRQIALN